MCFGRHRLVHVEHPRIRVDGCLSKDRLLVDHEVKPLLAGGNKRIWHLLHTAFYLRKHRSARRRLKSCVCERSSGLAGFNLRRLRCMALLREHWLPHFEGLQARRGLLLFVALRFRSNRKLTRKLCWLNQTRGVQAAAPLLFALVDRLFCEICAPLASSCRQDLVGWLFI